MNNELRAEIEKLKRAYPGSRLNGEVVFIAHQKTSMYLCFVGCQAPKDIQTMAVVWLSRACVCEEPYRRKSHNRKYRSYMLSCLNEYLGTNFTTDEMRTIYMLLGEGANKELAERFVDSDYDISLLRARG